MQINWFHLFVTNSIREFQVEVQDYRPHVSLPITSSYNQLLLLILHKHIRESVPNVLS